MCNPPNGFFAASPPRDDQPACILKCIAFPMTVPPTFIIDITLTKYRSVVNNRYGNSQTILEKFHAFCLQNRLQLFLSAARCQLSQQGGFRQKKMTEASEKASVIFMLRIAGITRCRGSWGWWRSPWPDPRRWGYSRPSRRRCTCCRPPYRSSRCRSGRIRWSFPRRSRGI